jgi:hypothetical protein
MEELTSMTTAKKASATEVDIITGYCSGITGADPEIFVVDKNGIIIPAFSFLSSQKKAKPSNIYSYYNVNSAIYNDGFQAEFSVNPYGCHSSIVDEIQSQMKKVLLAAREAVPGARLNCSSTLDIPEHLMAMASKNDVQLGCAPSNNAYSLQGRPIIDGREIPMRWCGWHMHASASIADLMRPNVANKAAKACDLFVGIASIALFGDRERRERRQYYGMPGEYRLPKHGFEYRSVSGMMGYHPVWTQLLLDTFRWAFQVGFNDLLKHANFKEQEVVKAIVESDVDAARGIIKDNLIIWKKFLNYRYRPNQYSDAGPVNRGEDALALLLGKKKLKDAGSVEANWKLDQQIVPWSQAARYKGPDWMTHAEASNCSVMRMEVA